MTTWQRAWRVYARLTWIWPLRLGLADLDRRVASTRDLTSFKYRRLTREWFRRRHTWVVDSREPGDDPITRWAMPAKEMQELNKLYEKRGGFHGRWRA